MKTELSKDIIELKRKGINIPDKLKIKISGDGAKVSRVSNFVVLSYSIMDVCDTQSHLNQRVLSIVNCEEKYANLKHSMQPSFAEINELVNETCIIVENDTIELEFFVGGDMKFIQLLLGLNSSIE